MIKGIDTDGVANKNKILISEFAGRLNLFGVSFIAFHILYNFSFF